MKQNLTFRLDGTFTIVQFTDIHWQKNEDVDNKSGSLMCMILDVEQPDFVVFTGDTIQCGQCLDQRLSFLKAVAPVEERGIPWAFVYGNHDAEWGITHSELMQVQQECSMCMTEPGPSELSGTGNYVLEIFNREKSKVKAAMYFFDSHEYAPEGIGQYAWIKRDQIDWYTRRSAMLTARNGCPLPGLAFFHIPLPEYKEVRRESTTFGNQLEVVHAPVINTGLFAAFIEMGDVMGTFAGHDHANDYWGEWYGIKLCYGRVTGYNTYPRNGEPRGARVIRLREGEREFDTWIRQDDGELITGARHDPEDS